MSWGFFGWVEEVVARFVKKRGVGSGVSCMGYIALMFTEGWVIAGGWNALRDCVQRRGRGIADG